MAGKRSTRRGTVLVVGGGIAGATAAGCLGRAGIEVHLVEKEEDIGGHAAAMGCKAADTCLRCNVCVAGETFRGVRGTPNVRLHTSTRLTALQRNGGPARFKATLTPGGRPRRKPFTIRADAVVLAAGYAPYNPVENSAFGYGSIANVVTGVEAERRLAEQNRITRPSDGRVPERVAFIQCVGSRTEERYRRAEDTDYCSAVCCSYALRIGRRIVQQAAESKITFFYMDIQNFGKGFNAFYARCKDTMRFVRSRPCELRAGRDGAVRVKYAPGAGEGDEGRSVREEEFDLVILAVGMRPPADAAALSAMLDVPLDEHGFVGRQGADAFPALHGEGIYVAGACEGPKDIAGSIAQAEAVSAVILGSLDGGGRAPGDILMNRPLDRRRPGKAGFMRRAVRGDVVVAGGGVAGMQAALGVARLGHPVTLVHAGGDLGGAAAAAPGMLAYLGGDRKAAADDVRRVLAGLCDELKGDRRVRIRRRTRVTAVEGELGDFTVTVSANGRSANLRAGAVVLATGAGLEPTAARLGAGARNIVDMTGLSARMAAGDIPERVALATDLACEQGRAVTAQVLSAAEALREQFKAEVRVYCSSVRVAASGLESLYRRARDAGAVITKTDARPKIGRRDGAVAITAEDAVTGAAVTEEFDLVVAADLAPPAAGTAGGLARGLKAGPEGALQYDDVWMLPALTSRPGVFAAGAARGNSEYRDALTDGLAVAQRIHRLLGAKRIEARDDAAGVDADKCVLCLTCVRICPHGAIGIDREARAASVSAVACQRCGLCAAECPAGAIALPGFTDAQMAARASGRRRLTVFACENSALPAAEAAGLGAKADLIRVPCAGKVDPRTVLQALESGARKVLIVGCHPGSCRYLQGAGRACRRAARLGAMLAKAGVDGSRVEFAGIAAVEPQRMKELVST
ncbi:MAG: hydrogenase iron-sulfur subunit [Lentisphaerae bacterium]|nr:hydrogenase iron-sulfur subunit [Lentisphaerota bacterium]